MTRIDHTNTRVLLIGASKFPNDTSLPGIPNVEVNIALLKKLFTDVSLIGVPEENITVSLNEDNSAIEKKLVDISEETKNKKYTLIVYYSGHGIMSQRDYQLYLATVKTSNKYLELEGVNIENFKNYINQSNAGRKVVILDCCHSGYIIGSMGDMDSKIQSELNRFEGTYVMTSAADDEPSLFPEDKPDKPTYFTGKLAEIVQHGLESSDTEYSSLKDIFKEIELDFAEQGLPKPKQSNYNSADQLYFARNKNFLPRKDADEAAWEKALQKNTEEAYLALIRDFPASKFARQAKTKIHELEDKECWEKACYKNTITAYLDYIDKFDDGKFIAEANEKIKTLSAKAEKKVEKETPVVIPKQEKQPPVVQKVVPKQTVVQKQPPVKPVVPPASKKKSNVPVSVWFIAGGAIVLFIVLFKVVTSINWNRNKYTPPFNYNSDTTSVIEEVIPEKTAQEYFDLGRSYYSQGYYADALSEFKNYNTLSPDDAGCYYNMGLCYGKLGNISEAAANFFSSGVRYQQNGDNAAAINSFNYAISYNISYGDAYNNRGVAYYETGLTELACEDFYNAAYYGSQMGLDNYNKICVPLGY